MNAQWTIRLIIAGMVFALGGRALADDKPATLAPENPRIVQAKMQRDRAEQRADRAQQRLAQLHAQVAALQDELRNKTGRVDVNPDSLRKAASRVENELESLQLDAAGGEARMEALTKTIADVAKRGEETAKGDEVAAQLAIVVAVREKEVAMLEKLAAQATVAQGEVEAKRATLAEAKARLAERRMNVAATAGGGALAEWNRELLDLSLDSQERQARTAFLRQTLDRLRTGLPLLNKYEEYLEAIPAARRDVADAARALETLNVAIQEEAPPTKDKP
jgi:chromosome segregation ATPase